MQLKLLGRYIRTLRHLTLKQFIYRLLKLSYLISLFNRNKPIERNIAFNKNDSIRFPRTVCSKNKTRTSYSSILIHGNSIPYSSNLWKSRKYTKLVQYKLNYFDYIFNEDETVDKSAIQIVNDWIDKSNLRSVGMQPYPTSLRIVNWIIWSETISFSSAKFRNSILDQLLFLSKNIEWDVGGNHLIANAKALIFGGIYFSGKDAKNILDNGIEMFEKQLHMQILSDGGHYERSVMYHSIILFDVIQLLELCYLNKSYFNKRFIFLLESTATKMWNWLCAMCHPDGEPTVFGDVVRNETIKPYQYKIFLNNYAVLKLLNFNKLKKPPILDVQSQSRYITFRNKNASLFWNVGGPSPDHQPGHSHADTLSLELSIKGKRFLVNPGTSTYDICPRRFYERSTMSHNTVAINKEDSNEIWSSFRVGRRARVKMISHNVIKNSATYIHDGYRYLPGKPNHKRKVKLSNTNLVIQDQVISKKYHNCFSYYFFSPEAKLTLINNQKILINIDELSVFLICKNGTIKIDNYEYAEGFNQRVEARFLSIKWLSSKEINQLEILW